MTEFFLELLREGGYLGVFVLMMLENVFPPIPSEVILGAAGVLVARGQMTFVTLWLVATAGTLAGNLCWYWLGLRWTEAQLKRVIDRWGRWLTFEWDEFTRARDTFRKHGDWIVFMLRFSPVFRTIVSLPAGLARMSLWRFAAFTFLGSLIWNGVLIFGGQALAEWVVRYEEIAGPAVIVAVIIGVLYYIYRVVTWTPARNHDQER